VARAEPELLAFEMIKTLLADIRIANNCELKPMVKLIGIGPVTTEEWLFYGKSPPKLAQCIKIIEINFMFINGLLR